MKTFIPIGIAITLLSLMIYGVAQQTIRLGANNPQIQMAEDAAANLERGDIPRSVIPNNNIDMASSLAPYMIVYDDNGEVLASSVELDGAVPNIPSGVLESVRDGREDRFTWQPKIGVRSAVVVVRSSNPPGFVLAGRSLREVEILEDQIGRDVLVGWVATIVATLGAFLLFGCPRKSGKS